MRKFLLYLTGCMILLFSITMFSCSSDNDIEDEIQKRQYNFFDVVEMINDGKYDDALRRINEVYNDIDYSTEIDGFNKMNLLRLFYEKQGLYDNAADVVKQYIVENGLSRYSINESDLDHVTAIKCMEALLEKVDEDTHKNLIQQLGEEWQ